MRAMVITDGSLTPAELPDPVPAAGEVLIEVAAAGINRADLLQLQGLHPPPPGAAEWPGLEASGTIRAVGPGVTQWSEGDRVCALLDGGGYAELALARADCLLPVPDSLEITEAAAFPEALGTLWSNLVSIPGLDGPAALIRPDTSPEPSSESHPAAGRSILVHGGSGGVGSVALQLFAGLGARVLTTAGGPERTARCLELGADTAIDHRAEDFVERVRALTDGRGVDAVLDPIGAAYLEQNVAVLAPGGHLAIIGMQKGTKATVNLAPLLAKWLTVHGTGLRGRPAAEKAAIIADVRRRAWPLVCEGTVRAVIHERLPLTEAMAGHRFLADGVAFGKVLLLP
ncbi:MAG TPA: NAD(P)H-quinone oxidoreductase [Candidatus Ruania gallistercoris]|uniref:NAD(P)H-quinone oxidoreductase n=1 Tax=Candidatus Ruania gallistercoris TaxID=2838746 RepID=A0A9D2J446_9MICO|nr:NAD(P)H-quinone oxidoreductase [Candidatus Ruania gallistercoris]